MTNEWPKDGEDMHIVCIKEFRDEFNSHESSTTNNSVNLHTKSIFPVRTSADSSHHTCPTTCENKSKDNMKNERTCMCTFNKVSNPVKGKNNVVKIVQTHSNCATRY